MVASFWGERLKRTANLVDDASPFDSDLEKLILPETHPDSGKIRLSPLISLMFQRNMGGSCWLQQFRFGFKLIGTPSPHRTCPPSPKLVDKAPLSPTKAAKANCRRFTESHRKSGFKNAQKPWAEAIEQNHKGWIAAPFPRSKTQGPFVIQYHMINIYFRFGAEQADKLRACDDIRYSMTNLAFAAVTPIKLASWGQVAEMCRSIRHIRQDWHIVKADHEAAHKQIPVDWEHSQLSAVALRPPSDGRWYGFLSRILMFRAVFDVLR